MGRIRDQHNQRKRDEAAQRQAEHDALSLEQKLAKALARGGSECKEYKRLKGSQ